MSIEKYYNGKTINEWAKECGIKRSLIAGRIKDGWTIEEATGIPYGNKRPKEKTLNQISLENHMSHKTLKKRIKQGMSVDQAIAYDYRKDYIGQKYYRLTVIKELDPKIDPKSQIIP